MLKNLESKRKPFLQHVNTSCWLLEPARRTDCGMSGNINSLLFLGALFGVCKKSCPGLSWFTPGDQRHCHNTQNIGCNCQKRDSGHKHMGMLEKFSSDFKPMLVIPKKSSNPWFPSDAELKEEWGGGGRNLSVVLTLFLVSPHPNGDVTELNSLRCPGKPSRGKLNQILQDLVAWMRMEFLRSSAHPPGSCPAWERAWPCFSPLYQNQHFMEENGLG